MAVTIITGGTGVEAEGAFFKSSLHTNDLDRRRDLTIHAAELLGISYDELLALGSQFQLQDGATRSEISSTLVVEDEPHIAGLYGYCVKACGMENVQGITRVDKVPEFFSSGGNCGTMILDNSTPGKLKGAEILAAMQVGGVFNNPDTRVIFNTGDSEMNGVSVQTAVRELIRIGFFSADQVVVANSKIGTLDDLSYCIKQLDDAGAITQSVGYAAEGLQPTDSLSAGQANLSSVLN